VTPAAVVTGAARGIGTAVAERLAAGGAHVVLADRDPAVTDVAAALAARGQAATGVVGDLTEASGRADVAAALDGLELRTLVLNAGITADALLAKMDDDAFLRVVRVNAGAAWALADLLIPRMAPGGAIVAMASRSYLGNVGQFNYAVSKGALVGMVRALALQLAPVVRVNAVAPGLVGTEMTLAMPDDVRERLVERIPARRMGRPEEIAEVVAQLAGDGLGYVTGQVVVACGGRSL